METLSFETSILQQTGYLKQRERTASPVNHDLLSFATCAPELPVFFLCVCVLLFFLWGWGELLFCLFCLSVCLFQYKILCNTLLQWQFVSKKNGWNQTSKSGYNVERAFSLGRWQQEHDFLFRWLHVSPCLWRVHAQTDLTVSVSMLFVWSYSNLLPKTLLRRPHSCHHQNTQLLSTHRLGTTKFQVHAS